jgi:hypothetical protein
VLAKVLSYAFDELTWESSLLVDKESTSEMHHSHPLIEHLSAGLFKGQSKYALLHLRIRSQNSTEDTNHRRVILEERSGIKIAGRYHQGNHRLYHHTHGQQPAQEIQK